MGDSRRGRVSRELFLAAFGSNRPGFESWVTDRLVSLLQEDELRAGETLYSAGDTPEFVYFMREGTIQLVREGLPKRTLEGLHVFGMGDGLLDRTRTRTAIAAIDLRLMKVRVDAWLELLDDSFELARASVLELARSIAHLEDRLDGPALSGGHASSWPEQVPAGRLNVVERLALLMEVPLLRGGGVQPLSDLAVASREIHFESGDELVERNARRERIFVVIEGQVDACREQPPGLRTARAGEIVGGAAAFGQPALLWNARATRRGRALAFRVDDWFDLMEEHFDLVRAALAALSMQHENLLDKLGAEPSS